MGNVDTVIVFDVPGELKSDEVENVCCVCLADRVSDSAMVAVVLTGNGLVNCGVFDPNVAVERFSDVKVTTDVESKVESVRLGVVVWINLVVVLDCVSAEFVVRTAGIVAVERVDDCPLVIGAAEVCDPVLDICVVCGSVTETTVVAEEAVVAGQAVPPVTPPALKRATSPVFKGVEVNDTDPVIPLNLMPT